MRADLWCAAGGDAEGGGDKKMTPKEIALKVAWSFLGEPYIWGGDDPMQGFDCSGFVIECLKSAGKLPREGDWTAMGLATMFPHLAEPYEGCLVFYGLPKIVHVELCLDDVFSIGASGGGSKTLTKADAIKQNAYIKVRPFRSRSGIACFADPFKEWKPAQLSIGGGYDTGTT
jgi:NlpC/P60 family